MKKIGAYIQNCFLLIPLIWYVDIWLSFVFDIGLSEDVLGEGAGDFIPDLVWILMLFVGTPLTFLVGAIYTYWTKCWFWFWAYMILGGGLVAAYFVLAFIDAYF